MITPIGTLNINQIAERKDDLLVSSEDIKALARNVRNTAIDEFTNRLKKEYQPCEATDTEIYTKVCNRIDEIAEEMRGAE